MEKVKGKIENKKIDEGIGKNDKPYKRAIFTVNNKKYSTFDEDIRKKFNVGDYVEILGEQKGKFFNMKDMNKIDREDIVKTEKVSDNSSKQERSNTLTAFEMKLISQLDSINANLQVIAEELKDGE